VSCRPLQVVLKLFADFVAVVGRLAREKADLVMPGRTHGQQALPITFGYKCAAWIDELLRHAERLCQSADRLFRAILGGATTSSLLPWLLAACLPAGLPACSPRLRWTRRTRGGGGSRRRDTFEWPAAAACAHAGPRPPHTPTLLSQRVRGCGACAVGGGGGAGGAGTYASFGQTGPEFERSGPRVSQCDD
jgi:hypothetical protein